MVTMDDSLTRLVKDGAVDAEAAREKAIEKKEFRKRMLELGHTVGAQDGDPEELEKLIAESIGLIG